MEETHRRDRKECKLLVNVSYLAKGLGRSRRTIQRYLAILEREGYLRTEVMSGHRSRMCIGLIVHLLAAAVSAPSTRVMGAKSRKSAKKSYR